MRGHLGWLAAVASLLAGTGLLAAGPTGSMGSGARAAPQPCTGDYAAGPYRPARLRFGVTTGIEGNVGTHQIKVPPIDQARELAALRALRPPGDELVLRINRLFESAGDPGLRRARAIVARDARAGFEIELQVRYHPTPRQAGDIPRWLTYVRQVVDAFAGDSHVVAMTITNEANVTVSPNTSDGAYPGAEQALVRGIVAAHREALAHHDPQLRFGFTYAYRFGPVSDAAFFAGLRAGGAAFRRALGFVGVDFYPALIPGPAVALRPATLQMLGTVRRCFMRLAGLGTQVPIWITENDYPSAPATLGRQAAALRRIVSTIHGAARTFGVTDYRWFNLRDDRPRDPAGSGLLTVSYARKPAFAVLRSLVVRYGTHPRRRDDSLTRSWRIGA